MSAQTDSGSVGINGKRYRVTHVHDHSTLKVGDVVAMGQAPGFMNILVRDDLTVHKISDQHEQYVHLEEIS